MPASEAKKLTLCAVSTLGTIPGGRLLIEFMGHMSPASQLKFEGGGLQFPSRVGLGCGISETAGDVKAFEKFGFGFIELGPLTLAAVPDQEDVQLQKSQFALTGKDVPCNAGLDSFLKRHLPSSRLSLPLLIRVAHVPGTAADTACDELVRTASALPDWIGALVIDTRWCLTAWSEQELDRYLEAATKNAKTVLLSVAPDESHDFVRRLVTTAIRCGVKGISVTGGVRSGQGLRTYGRPTQELSLGMIRLIRSIDADLLVIGGDGVIEPADAVKLQAAGADLVSVYSGFVYSGPGLAKRINELMTTVMPPAAGLNDEETVLAPYSFRSVLNSGWLGIALVGFGLMLVGASAITVALTTVILPYDESFLGITRESLVRINPRLLPFLSHDRVTYAGAGMSCGILFFSLTYFGGRFGQRWAYTAASIACAAGFASFLLFLVYGFLDPLHALVTLSLVPFLVWGLVKRPQWRPMRSSNMHNSAAWRHSLTGQFLFVCISVGLLLAGAAICTIGSTTVFVPEDLMFMQTDAHHLLNHNHHLLPEIAHDRAGFGGTLVTAGLAVLLTSLHGFRQGEGWIWWMLLIAGLPGYVSTLGIHFAIGYTHFSHLFPAYIATLMFVAGLALSYKYLCEEPGSDSLREPA